MPQLAFDVVQVVQQPLTFCAVQERIQAFTKQLEEDDIATRFTHRLDGNKQWQYNQVMQRALPTAALLACDACLCSSACFLIVLAPSAAAAAVPQLGCESHACSDASVGAADAD